MGRTTDITTGRRPDAVWLLSLPLVCWAVLAASAVLGPRFDHNLWDNFEFFSPIINYAHGLWLRGEVPLWNPHQHLGEPILAAGQPGALYAPYTLSVFLLGTLGLDAAHLMLVIVLIHVPFGALGWFLLMRRLGARPSVAMVGALSVSFGGFVTAVTTVWVFMLAVFVWLPWILHGIVLQFRKGRWSGVTPLVGGLVATAFVGHPQMLIYQWLTVVLVFVGFGLVVFRRPMEMARIGLFFLLALVLSLPALLPMQEMLSLSVRTTVFSRDEFLLRGVKPRALVGWLSPFFRAYNGFLPDRASVMGFQGAWVVPALLGGLAAFAPSRRRPADPDGHSDMTVRAFIVSLGASAALLVLALGGETPLYRLTHGIPVWSSMRYPFKFFLFSQPVLVLAATLGLELWARHRSEREFSRWVPVLLFLVMAALAGWKLDLVPLGGKLETLGLLAGGVILAALPFLGRHWSSTAVLLLGSFASAVAVTASAHDMGMKRYPEPYGRIGAEHLGVTGDARVLPLTTQRWGHPVMQPLALLHSATANAYDSATGTQAGLIPEWFEASLSVDVFGVPRPGTLEAFLPSHMLRSFNIGYLVVASEDRASRRSLETAGGFTLVREGQASATYRTDGVLPRAYFSSRIYRYTPQGLSQGLWLNGAPVDSAFVDGWSGPETAAVGRVVHAAWGTTRVRVDVEAPAGGFLVLSMSFYPGWTCATDGRPARLERVNRRLMGVVVPPGARQVALEFHSRALRLGIVLAVAGGGFLCVALAAGPCLLSRVGSQSARRRCGDAGMG